MRHSLQNRVHQCFEQMVNENQDLAYLLAQSGCSLRQFALLMLDHLAAQGEDIAVSEKLSPPVLGNLARAAEAVVSERELPENFADIRGSLQESVAEAALQAQEQMSAEDPEGRDFPIGLKYGP